MLAQDPYLEVVVARLYEFFGRDTAWPRRLWCLGSILALDEVVEAAGFCQRGQFLPGAVRPLFVATAHQVLADEGLGSGEFRNELRQHLIGSAFENAQETRQLEHLVRRARLGYLDRLAATARGPEPPSAEALARAVGAHLLDAGFSGDHLYRWVDALVRSSDTVTIGDVFEDAQRVEATRYKRYEVLVPMVRMPSMQAVASHQWLDPAEVSRRLPGGAPYKGLRQVGAFRLNIKARDPWGAVDQAVDMLERLAARVTVGIPGQQAFEDAGLAWVTGKQKPYRVRRVRRGVEVHALSRQSLVYEVDGRSSLSIDAALQLLSALDAGAPGAAVAGGWAAVESLLSDPGDDGAYVAAERLAHLVACSLPRAELTALSYIHAEHGTDALARALAVVSQNRRRAGELEVALLSGQALTTPKITDRAATERVTALLTQPRTILKGVVTHVNQAILRLYRQRNLVMHSGSTSSVALAATLRTAPSLVGAGIDRVVHAAADESLAPLDLAARAKTELALVGTSGGRLVVDLLTR